MVRIGFVRTYDEFTSGLNILQNIISKNALHDGGARYPPPRCHLGTREKLLKTITDWINDLDTSFPVMWLYGPAGGGKSAIAQTIAEKCDHEGKSAASFFFLRESEDRGTAMPLFPTLAWQLAHSIPGTAACIEFAIRKYLDKQFNHLIVQPFRNYLNESFTRDLLMVIDGVDECAGESSQRDLLKLIGEALIEKSEIPLRFLICSRPETHMKETFNSSAFSNITHTALLDNSLESLDDIRTYFLSEFSRIREERRIDSLPWPSENVLAKLVYDSSGQFVYATTVIKFVDDKYCDPRKQLEIVLGLLPAGLIFPFAELDHLYTTILSQQPDRTVLKEVLMCTIGLIRPSVRSISEILGISEDELRWKLTGMHSLLRISDSIETYHASLHDFLQDPRRAGEFYLDPEVIMALYLKPIETLKQFAVLYATHDSPAADPLFPTLAWQLVDSVPETATYIAAAVRADPLLPTKSLEIQIDQLIVRPLEKALGGNRPKKNVVVIDGIGECGNKRAQRHILKLIADNLVGRGVPLRFLISSRMEAHITKIFSAIKPFVRIVELDDGWKDVRRYLKDELARIHNRHRPPPQWLKDFVFNPLEWSPWGLDCSFLCATSIIMFMKENMSPGPLNIFALHATRRLMLHSKLDWLYAFILSRS
jgi:hypothetical protein